MSGQPALPPGDPRHGRTGYTKYGCRCEDVCKPAQRAYMRRYRGSQNGDRSPRQHGTRSCYVAGCRREECTKANRDYQREYMRFHRRELSWTDPDIEEALR